MRSWVTARCDPYKDPIPEIPRDIVLAAAAVYIEAFETITGKVFEVPTGAVKVLERIRSNIAAFF